MLAASAAARAAVKEERAVRSAQDADFQQSLATDAARTLAAEQQAEVLAQAHEQTATEAAAQQQVSERLAAAKREAVTTLPVRRGARCTLTWTHTDTILCTGDAHWNHACCLWRSISFTSTLSRTSSRQRCGPQR